MTSSESLSLSDSGSEMQRRDAPDHVSKTVKRAQSEVDRLIAALAENGQLPEMEDVVFDDFEPEESDQHRSRSAPVHLIISSKRALTRKYSWRGFERLDSDLHDLKAAIESRGDLDAVITYVDDEQSLDEFGLQPVEATNPWQVKKLVDGVDARLREQGREVRYLLIIGGDGVIPFHRLPNPVDDQDSDVPSDNPYACRDANYLVPERAIGRMPDGETEGIRFLHALIQTSAEAHANRAVSKGVLRTLSATLSRIRRPSVNDNGLGYSASIWRKASRAVFRVIGDDGRLRTSPPLTYEGYQVSDAPHFSYFNLHGVEDGPNWYGQRDALFPADYPLFPLALRPQDPSINQHAKAVVFTEACYGANILGKNEVDSIALRLLAAGALGVVGSTKVSYGSIAPPLLGADLIGRHFWEGLQAHLTVGEALRHAKVSMANEMQKRQGYLDDEDQKALISFVLYGDPSLSITSIHRKTAASASTDAFCPPIICSKARQVQKSITSDDLVDTVRARIETSLPHMSHAKVRAKPLNLCTDTCQKGCGLLDDEARRSLPPALEQKSLTRHGQGWALTLQKNIPVKGDGAHHQVVKVVVDESGHIVKMAISK